MFGIIPKRRKGPLSEINTAEPVYKKVKCIDGTIQHVFHDNLVHLLDRFFLTGNYQTLSPEQCKFIFKYLEEADKLTDNENDIYEDAVVPILGKGKVGYLVLTENLPYMYLDTSKLDDARLAETPDVVTVNTYSLRQQSSNETTSNNLSPEYEQLDKYLGSYMV